MLANPRTYDLFKAAPHTTVSYTLVHNSVCRRRTRERGGHCLTLERTSVGGIRHGPEGRGLEQAKDPTSDLVGAHPGLRGEIYE